MAETPAEPEEMPEVEFEGPLGRFWPMSGVPTGALAKGAAEIIEEMLKRGYSQTAVLDMIRMARRSLHKTKE